MFASGNWVILGIDAETVPVFEANLSHTPLMLKRSQVVNRVITKHRQFDTYGINPYRSPRLDEKLNAEAFGQSTALKIEEGLLSASAIDGLTADHLSQIEGLVGETFRLLYASDADAFRVTSTLYAFWFVLNRWKDIDHVNSRKEQVAYDRVQRPYKFLDKDMKKDVDALVELSASIERKQFPVMIDTQTGRIYAETTTKGDVESLISLLEGLGLRVTGLAWQFGQKPSWPSDFLQQVWVDTKYKEAFAKRVEDIKTFDGGEREKLEDAELEKIVSNFFACTELESGAWASLKAAAAIKLYPNTSAITVQTPTNATILLSSTEQSYVEAATVLFQERITYERKGVEVVARKDLYSLDVSDQMNFTDVGAAYLKGFDVPSFTKRVIKDMKKTKQAYELPEYWRMWRDEMNTAILDFIGNVIDVLGLTRDDKAGLVPYVFSENDDVIEDNDELLHTKVANGEITIELSMGSGS
jgi:hypothetical protein